MRVVLFSLAFLDCQSNSWNGNSFYISCYTVAQHDGCSVMDDMNAHPGPEGWLIPQEQKITGILRGSLSKNELAVRVQHFPGLET